MAKSMALTTRKVLYFCNMVVKTPKYKYKANFNTLQVRCFNLRHDYLAFLN